jgi:hypothetical protein
MRRFALPIVVAVAATVGGCTCGSRKPSLPDAETPRASVDAAKAGGPAPEAAATGPASQADFSAPIAAARLAHGDAVAGLVANAGVLRAMSLTDQGTTWVSDALSPVAWSPDAELRLQRAGDGLVLLWRGMFQGKNGRTVVFLGPDGKPRGEPFAVGAAFCATDDGASWVVERPDGSSRVASRRWTEAAAHDVLVVSSEHDPPSLVCADHTVIVLGDSDDDLTAASFGPGDAATQSSVVVLRDADFGDDEEREHDAYSIGDDLGLVRIGASGSVALRERPRAAAPTPWRRVKRRIPADDDVVAVDGNAAATLIVTTHDAEAACPGVGSTAAGVRAIRVDRKTGDDSLLELAPADCAVTPGPFWIADSPQGQVVSWVERRARASADAPPISSLAYRVIRSDGVRSDKIEQPSDALVDGGCDSAGCSVAALVRSPGADAMQPSAIRVFHY